MHTLEEEVGNVQVLHPCKEFKMVNEVQANPRNEPVDMSGRACAYNDNADILLCLFLITLGAALCINFISTLFKEASEAKQQQVIFKHTCNLPKLGSSMLQSQFKESSHKTGSSLPLPLI